MPEQAVPSREVLAAELEIMTILANDDSSRAEKTAVASLAAFFGATKATISKAEPGCEHPDQVVRVSGGLMSVKLFAEGSCTGQLLLSRSAPSWSAEEGSLLRRFAELMAPALATRERKRGKLSMQKLRLATLLLQERRLVDLTNGSPEMIYTTSVDDSITSINDAGVRLLGYDNPRDLIGRQFAGLALNQEDRDYLLQRLEIKHKVENYEIVLLRKDGSPVFCLESVSFMKNRAGKFLGLQGIIKNISDRIDTERALWESNLDLASLNQKLRMTQDMMVQQEKLASIGQLAAGIAHEINNPLGFLKSNFETTRQIVQEFHEYMDSSRLAGAATFSTKWPAAYFQQAFADLADIFTESEAGFKRIIRIVRDLKSFARTEQGNAVADINLNQEIESAIVIAWNEIKYVAVVHNTPGDIPEIKGREGELSQVVLNMLINATQAISSQKRPQKGNIEILTLVSNESIRLIIRDDGPGVPREIQSRIFDPFFTTKEPGEGTGLGLSISYDIVVNRYGGHLEVKSSPGEGTEFSIELPIKTMPSVE